MNWKQLGTVLAAVWLGGCMLGPNYKQPDLDLPAGQTAENFSVFTNSKWWEVFQDPVLNQLEADALEHNKDLQAAIARVDQARAEVGIATVDKATAAITKLTDSYYQLSSLASVYYVDPVPMPVEGLALSWKDGQLTASFSAPSTDQNGDALASLAKAELYRLNEGSWELEETLDNPVPGQVCTITHATSESGLQTYAVRVEDAEGNASAYVTAQVTQVEITLPYANGFEADETEAMAALTNSDPLGEGRHGTDAGSGLRRRMVFQADQQLQF